MQKKQGISLIVLVITIIVMVILAGAIILTLNNSGIIGKASEAVEQTNFNQLKQIAQLGWAEAYADGARTEDELREGVVHALEKNNIKEDDVILMVTTEGVQIAFASSKWEQNGTIVSKGDIKLTVGDYVNYIATGTDYVANSEKSDDWGKWQLLGAEDGKLLLISSKSVEKLSAGGTAFMNNATQQLATICEKYGNGTGAIQSRNISLDDILRITGYNRIFEDITYYILKESNEEIYGDGYHGYCLFVKEGENYTISAAYDNASDVEQDTYFDGTNYVKFPSVTITDLDKYIEFVTGKNDVTKDFGVSLIKNTKAYSMLFGENFDSDINDSETDVNQYVTSTDFITLDDFGSGRQIVRGYYMVKTDVTKFYFSGDLGDQDGCDMGVRPVVILNKDVMLSGSSTDGWTIK